jgi:hypothetical protein
MFQSFILSVKPTEDPKRYTVRVTKRLSCHPFQQALVISPGTVLELRSGAKKNPTTRFLFVRTFRPKQYYNGRPIASGDLFVD